MISCWMKTVWIFNGAGAASNHLDRPEVREAFDAGEGSSHRHSASVGYETFYYAIKQCHSFKPRCQDRADALSASVDLWCFVSGHGARFSDDFGALSDQTLGRSD